MNIAAKLNTSLAGSAFRLYMGGHAVVSWFLMLSEPRALIRLVASSDAGIALVWLLMLIGLVAIADAVINDILPKQYQWRLVRQHRHLILASMAFCYVAQIYVAFYSLRSPGLMLSDLWNAGSIMFIAIVDAHQRSKDAPCPATTN